MINEIFYAEGRSFEVRTGEDAFYGVAGKVWAVVMPDGAATVGMSQAPYVTIGEGMKLAGVTRYCKKAVKYQEHEQHRLFGLMREAAREFLGQYGPVVTGVASCGQLCDRRTGRVLAEV